MQQHYDEIATFPHSRVVLGDTGPKVHTGPLPRERGVHLVAGVARLGGVEVVGTIPDGNPFSGYGSPLLSVGGRWLAVQLPDEIRLHDLHDGCRPGFCFRPAREPGEVSMSIHPNGELLAVRRGNRAGIALPDGETLLWADLPGRKSQWAFEELQFSACGNYLWFAGTAEDGDRLWLLRARDLAVLDSVPAPFDPEHPYDSRETGWSELTMVPFAARNLTAMERTGGDSFYGVWFYGIEGDKIVSYPEFVSSAADGSDGEPLNGLTFHPGGECFLTCSRYGEVCGWIWPHCRVTANTAESTIVKSWDHGDLDEMAFSGDVVLASFGDGDLHVIGTPGFERGVASPIPEAGQLLPNGLLLHTKRQGIEVHRLVVGEETAVLIELDSATGFARKIVRRVDGRWQEETRAVWAQPWFPLAEV